MKSWIRLAAARPVGVSVVCLAVAGASAWLTVPHAAAQSSDAKNVNVSASVLRNCRITTTGAIQFGDYDVNAASDVLQQGQIGVACTKGVQAQAEDGVPESTIYKSINRGAIAPASFIPVAEQAGLARLSAERVRAELVKLLAAPGAARAQQDATPAWPEVTREAKPWTRWS